MKIGIKQLLAIMLMAVMLVITACGNNGGNTTSNSGNNNSGNSNTSGASNSDSKKDEKTFVMKIGAGTTNDALTKSMDLLKTEIEAKSDGRIKVELYPSGQLGGSKQVLEQVALGNVQMYVTNTGNLTQFSDIIGVVGAPYLFPDVQAAKTYMNEEGYKIVEPQLNEKGITVLRYFAFGPRVLLTTKKITTMDDFDGMKIRTLPSPILIDQWNSVGAAGVPMGVGELYTALQQGTIDAIEGAPAFYVSMKYFELADYVLLEPQGSLVATFATSKQFMDSLPDDLDKIVRDAAKKVAPEANEIAKVDIENALKTLEDEGLEIIDSSAALHDKMVEATEVVYTNLYGNVDGSKEWVEQIKEYLSKQ